MRHKLTVLLACACALSALVSATAFGAGSDPPPPDQAPAMTTEDGQETETGAPQPDPSVFHRIIQRHRREAWHWERVMGRPLTRQLAHAPTEAEQRMEAWRRLAFSMRRPLGVSPEPLLAGAGTSPSFSSRAAGCSSRRRARSFSSQRMCWLASAKNRRTVGGRVSRRALSNRSTTGLSSSSA